MSRTTVTLALVLAIALSAAAYFLLRPSAAPPSAGPLLDFQPSGARLLRVQAPGRPAERAERAGDAWLIAREEAGRPGPGWPAALPNIRAALRILSSLSAKAPAPDAGPLDDEYARIEVGLDDGTARAFRLGTRPLSGRVLLEVEDAGPARPELTSRLFWVEADLSEALVSTGLLAWRERTAFPGLGRDAARVTLASDRGTVSLARVSGKWALREPVGAPADPAAVNTLLDAIASVQVIDFGDRGLATPATASPLGRMVIESETREPRADGVLTRTRTREIEFAGIIGLANDQVLVRVVDRTTSGGSSGQDDPESKAEYAFAVPAASVTAIPAAPESFLARTAFPSASADVGRVVITRAGAGRAFARTLDGWAEPRAEGSPVPLPEQDRAGVEALVRLACEARAADARLSEPQGWAAAWTVEFGSLGGAPLGSIEVGSAAGGTVIKTAEVFRTFDPAAAPVARWLGQIAP